MEAPSGVNLELSLLGDDRHRIWNFASGSRGSTTTNPQMVSDPEVPPGPLLGNRQPEATIHA